jgi:hypothetical protein
MKLVEGQCEHPALDTRGARKRPTGARLDRPRWFRAATAASVRSEGRGRGFGETGASGSHRSCRCRGPWAPCLAVLAAQIPASGWSTQVTGRSYGFRRCRALRWPCPRAHTTRPRRTPRQVGTPRWLSARSVPLCTILRSRKRRHLGMWRPRGDRSDSCRTQSSCGTRHRRRRVRVSSRAGRRR